MFRVALPITMPSDRAALEVALRGCAQPQPAARMVFIRDTLTLDHLYVSPNLRRAVEEHPRLSIQEEVPLEFTADGVMRLPWALA
ncbi:MAG: hypothetical protein DCC55_33610 [Chloroflexi bacterium]|nr:MAG: hypothetical protein DCC55_33610 [Chloroflexota bacterium]